MTVYIYPGNAPSNVSKDAKYSVKRVANGWAVHLLFNLGNGQRELLTTDQHAELVSMVNRVKAHSTGKDGGAFYINEYRHVVVPTPDGAVYAGSYTKDLRFAFEGQTIEPSAPKGLKPGQEWKGPHVGVRYTLAAGGGDIYYERKLSASRTERVQLSEQRGQRTAQLLARRLSSVKGQSGGRIYINEQCEFFGPMVVGQGGTQFVYLGHLEDDAWFDEPELPDDADG